MKIGVKMTMSGIVEGWDVVGRCLGVYYELHRSSIGHRLTIFTPIFTHSLTPLTQSVRLE